MMKAQYGTRATRCHAQKVARREGTGQNDVKNKDRSGDMYENKGQRNKMTDCKGRICPTQSDVWVGKART